eukprot:scaffold3848_cov198-Alexandrium_tamarense.AAC.6
MAKKQAKKDKELAEKQAKKAKEQAKKDSQNKSKKVVVEKQKKAVASAKVSTALLILVLISYFRCNTITYHQHYTFNTNTTTKTSAVEKKKVEIKKQQSQPIEMKSVGLNTDTLQKIKDAESKYDAAGKKIAVPAPAPAPEKPVKGLKNLELWGNDDAITTLLRSASLYQCTHGRGTILAWKIADARIPSRSQSVSTMRTVHESSNQCCHDPKATAAATSQKLSSNENANLLFWQWQRRLSTVLIRNERFVLSIARGSQ